MRNAIEFIGAICGIILSGLRFYGCSSLPTELNPAPSTETKILNSVPWPPQEIEISMTKTNSPNPKTRETQSIPVPPRYMALALDVQSDLASHLGVAPEDILFVKIYQDEFPADFLNCQDQKSTLSSNPAFVTGTVIVYAYAGNTYSYYSRGRQFATCDIFQ